METRTVRSIAAGKGRGGNGEVSPPEFRGVRADMRGARAAAFVSKKGALGGNMVSPEGRSGREAGAEDAAMDRSRELAAGQQ